MEPSRPQVHTRPLRCQCRSHCKLPSAVSQSARSKREGCGTVYRPPEPEALRNRSGQRSGWQPAAVHRRPSSSPIALGSKWAQLPRTRGRGPLMGPSMISIYRHTLSKTVLIVTVTSLARHLPLSGSLSTLLRLDKLPSIQIELEAGFPWTPTCLQVCLSPLRFSQQFT